MSKIVLNDVTNLNALSVINDNFDKLEQELQTKVLYRDNPDGEPNTLENDVDANGNSLYNIQDLTITGSFTVNGLNIEEVVADAAADIEANAASALNSATTAAASAASATASASSATASASTATTKASEASSSATSAANSATTATTQAGIATTGAATATTKASEASTSASNAATSASTATTQAGIATTKAGEASTSATNAATSASNASTSATSAANSAAAAATALDSFDDRYLGTKASDPTLDNDGNALLTGALYYNTTTQTMKVYDGANWIAATAAGTASMSVYKYVATAGQTTFSGAATVGGTMSYTSGNIIVFLNGASLDSTDYTATNGTSVVLSVAASLNDEVVIVAFKSFTVADTYTQSAADAAFVKQINGTTSTDLTVNGVKVGKGAGSVATNTAVGASALAANSTGSGVTAIGADALAVSTASNNTAVGYQAAYANTAADNTAIGVKAMLTNTTGTLNVATGGSALRLNTTGSSNTAMGVSALFSNTTASNNTAVGYQAGYGNTTGIGNTYLGDRVGHDNAVGNYNTYVGGYCAYATSGSSNTFIGNESGYLVTTGSKNTILGRYNGNQGGLNISTASNYIVLSDGDGNPRGFFNDSGYFRINNADGGNYLFKIKFAGDSQEGIGLQSSVSGSGNMLRFLNSAGTTVGLVSTNNTNTTYATSSDYRLKNIDGGLIGYKERIMALQPKQGSWKADGSEFRGFLAHEFAEQYPASVNGKKDAVDADGNPQYQGMQAGGAETIADLVAFIKELNAKVDAQAAEIAALKGQP